MIAQLRQICPCEISVCVFEMDYSPTSTECVRVPGMVPGALKRCAMSSFWHTQLYFEWGIFRQRLLKTREKDMTVGGHSCTCIR